MTRGAPLTPEEVNRQATEYMRSCGADDATIAAAGCVGSKLLTIYSDVVAIAAAEHRVDYKKVYTASMMMMLKSWEIIHGPSL